MPSSDSKKIKTIDEIAENQKIIENLNASLSKKTKQVELIQAISSEVNSTLQWEQILNIILQSMDRAFDFHHAMIFLIDDSNDKLSVVASHGFDESGIGAEILIDQGIVGVVAKRKKIMRMGNIGSQIAYHFAITMRMEEVGEGQNIADTIELPGLKNVQSKIAVPLLVKSRLIGVFSVESSLFNAFDELDETLLVIFGNQIAGAIDNAHAYKLAEDRLDELNSANDQLYQLNEELEDQVRRRTADLSNALKELIETQNQLLLQEKMASLGTLVAGLSHEINNPLGAMGSAMDMLRRCLEKFETELESSYRKRVDKPLHLMLVNLGVLNTAQKRITTLVSSLKNFARLDEAAMQKADIHEGLESTLTLLKSEISEKITIVKEYGELTKIFCSPGQLNQVLMSLLSNSIQSIETTGTINIKTFLKDEHIYVKVADTGKGISHDKLEKIFDFGFSSNQSRVKMGAGLPTAYNIIQKHKGEIKFESEVGVGSTVTVILPTNLEQNIRMN
jgi:signal transduction histidine kinase